MEPTTETMSQNNVEPFLHFSKFAYDTSQQFTGTNGHGRKASYIPHSKLYEYWTQPRIRAVLNSHTPYLTTSPKLIREHYLRVFSTLVYTNQVLYLPQFIRANFDDRFPSDEFSAHWPRAVMYEEMFEKYKQAHWMFFPFVFESDRLSDVEIPTECILPIADEQELKTGDTTTVRIITIHEACNSLHKDGKRPARPAKVILKSYHGDRFLSDYTNEVRALGVLEETRSEHIITYFGAFRQGDKYNLILELADGGNLDRFLRDNEPPRTKHDVRDFWKSMFGVLEGLHRVHRASVEEDSSELRLIHGDLKPDNILISNIDPELKYRFSAKLTDFGYSDLRFVDANGGDKLGIDRRGNQTYCAPECSHHAKSLPRGRNRTTSLPDIFSAGAILSDAAVWLAFGNAGRTDYFNLRLEATTAINAFKKSGYEGCFHNGIERLSVVTEKHAEVLNFLDKVVPSDNITRQVLRLVEDNMLQRGTSRWDAHELLLRFDEILQPSGRDHHDPSNDHTSILSSSLVSRASKGLASPACSVTSPSSGLKRQWSETVAQPSFDGARSPPKSPSPAEFRPIAKARSHSSSATLDTSAQSPERTPSIPVAPVMSHGAPIGDEGGAFKNNLTRQPTPSDHRPGLSRLLSQHSLTLQQAAEYREARTSGRTVDPSVHILMKKLETNLKGRDHFFFIDDSPTMKEHSRSIEHAFETLAYIAKSIDTNGVELSFASSPSVRHKYRRTDTLVDIVKHHEYLHDGQLMEANLANLVDNVIIPRLPKHFLGRNWFGQTPMSIFVFTDGQWGPPGTGSPCSGVEEPVKRLMNEILERKLTRTKVMIQFVRFGDDEDGKLRLQYLDNMGRDTCDVVDTRSINGNVYTMFIGSIGRAHDDEPDV